MQALEVQLERLKRTCGVGTDTAFADFLGISQGAISGAKKKGQLPYSWFFQVAEKTGTSADWLCFGRGPMRPGEEAKPTENTTQTASTLKVAVPGEAACERCARLEQELVKKNQQFDSAFEKLVEMGQDAMRLTEEVGRLRLENLKLAHRLDSTDRMCREYAAALKEIGAADPIFDEQQIIPPNSQLER